ncbi:MAG: glycosyltransferase family 39 protein, partial [Anaerolineae bacterium]
IDTSDMDVVRHLNPHVDNGKATVDGNINLITHHAEAESFPWRGTILAVHLIRFLSVLMGAATVYLTYRLALTLMPDRPTLALIAAATNAFTPMFLFISGAVNNDNLTIPLCSLALLLMVRIVKGTEDGGPLRGTNSTFYVLRFTPYVLRFTFLGSVVGLALLTKESAGGLVILTALTVAYVAWRERALKTFLVGGLASGGPTLLIAGWWYLRNWRLYDDPTGQNVFIEVLGQRDVPADLAQLWRERISFMRGYWGNFGGLNVLMADWVYIAFDVLLFLAALGLVLGVVIHIRRCQARKSANVQICKSASWIVVLLWPTLVLVLWIMWATNTWSSQGRLVFSAISVWSLLLVLGWHTLANLLPKNLRSFALICVPLFMLAISLVAPWAWIRPAYARPPALSDEQVATISQRVDAVFFHPAGGQLKFLGHSDPVETVYPGQTVPVTLYWEAVEPFQRDYSISLQLVDEYNLVVAQRDAFPGMGTLLTSQLTPGQPFGELRTLRWAERRVLTLPETAFSPNQAGFELGLYDYITKERLAFADAGGQVAGDRVRFGRVEVLARAGDTPNPISVDFGGEIELVGYDLDRRALKPGETTTLTLYWRGQRAMTVDYSISTQLVDEYQVKAAQKDAWPFDGALPTSIWEPGDLIAEARELTVFDGASPGVYDVYVAVYPSGNPDALLVVTPPGGLLQTDHVVLTTISVLP